MCGHFGRPNDFAARLDDHRPFRTNDPTGVTAGAKLIINGVFLVRPNRDGIHRAILGAQRATDACVRDPVVNEGSTSTRWALTPDVGLVLFPEIPQRGEDRIRCGLAQSTDTSRLDSLR